LITLLKRRAAAAVVVPGSAEMSCRLFETDELELVTKYSKQ